MDSSGPLALPVISTSVKENYKDKLRLRAAPALILINLLAVLQSSKKQFEDYNTITIPYFSLDTKQKIKRQQKYSVVKELLAN